MKNRTDFPALMAKLGPVQEGRIHVSCPTCNRKTANVPRDIKYDPATAVLFVTNCERHDEASVNEAYYAADGQEIALDFNAHE